MNTPDPFARIRGQLHQAAAYIRLSAGSEIATIRAAHRRRHRTRALIGVTTAAAVGTGTVVAIQQLGKTSPGELGIGEGTGTTPDQEVAPDDVVASTPPTTLVPASTTPAAVGTVPPGPPEVALQPAVPAESAYTWSSMTPAAAQAVSGMWQGRVPGVIISTGPGRASDPNAVPTQQAYYTSDGITFELLDVAPSGGIGPSARLFADGDSIYRVGTAPGVAETEPNPLLVDVSTDRGATWTTIEIPVDTHELRQLPFVASGHDVNVTMTEAGPVILVNRWTGLDLREFPEINGDAWELTETGIRVRNQACFDNAVPTTIAVSGGTIARGPEPTIAPSGTVDSEAPAGCETREYTFAEIGIPPESIEAVGSMQGRTASWVYRVVDGRAVEIAPPAGVTQLSHAGLDGLFYGIVDEEGNHVRYRLGADLTWATVDLPAPIAWSGSMPLSSATHEFATVHLDGEGSALAASAGGEWTYTALNALYGEFQQIQQFSPAVTPDGLALGVAVRTDVIAEQGGVSVTRDGVTLHQATGDGSEMEFLDSATGEPLDGVSIDWNTPDGAPRVLAADGTVLAEFSGADMESLNVYDETAQWAIATTADGVHVASESVAELLGVSDDDIVGLRVNAVERQVIVTVVLDNEVSPGVKEQRVLVGTPNE